MSLAFDLDRTTAPPPGMMAPATIRPLEPVVFLPGLLCDQALWHHQVRALADMSAPMVADLTLDSSIAAMARRTLTAAPPRFSLVGLSMGGYVALEIMRQAPERVRRLALVDTSARADSPERIAQRQAGMTSLRHGKFVGITRRLLGDLVHPRHVESHVAGEMRAMALRVGGEAFLRQQMAIMTRADARPTLSSLPAETLVVVGEDDRVTPVEHAEEMHAGIGGSTLHVIPNCGHMPALEEPDLLSDLLRDWLQAGEA